MCVCFRFCAMLSSFISGCGLNVVTPFLRPPDDGERRRMVNRNTDEWLGSLEEVDWNGNFVQENGISWANFIIFGLR